MPNLPRDWPTIAKQTRDNAAEAAQAGIRALWPVVSGKCGEVEMIRRQAIALACLERIARLMESVGACTRPGGVDD